MICDRTIICVASRWDLDPTSKHQIMKRLAQRNRVIWVNYHGMRRPTLSLMDLRAASSAMVRVLRGARRVNGSMVQFTPLLIPGVQNSRLRRISRGAVLAQIRRVMKRLNGWAAQPVQIWAFAPDVAYLAGQFDEECFVYYCVDEFSQFEGCDSGAIRNSERDMLANADVVITTSEALYQAKRLVHANTHLVRHGVDVDHFTRALMPGIERPSDLKGLEGPIVGFFGLFHHWIDVELIAEVAERLPHAQFVLIGDANMDLKVLRRRPNIRLLGRRPYETLPAYCAAFDVAILPFRCNAMTRTINPIKLREYLAAGLPVVSTPLPEAMRYVPEVTIASNVDDFAEACRVHLQSNGISDRVRRSRCVRSETWESTIERLSTIIMDGSPVGLKVKG
ncbi:MAG: glycosyltransferase [Planctomycetes bacterium]|nr:glycosyltransferase [Planctomycetota bacterium]